MKIIRKAEPENSDLSADVKHTDFPHWKYRYFLFQIILFVTGMLYFPFASAEGNKIHTKKSGNIYTQNKDIGKMVGTLYAGKNPVCRITVSPAAPKLADRAALELQKYLWKIFHVRLQISRGAAEAGCIFIERVQTGWQTAQYDRTRMTCRDGVIRLSGENEIALMYAVYDFLQKTLDCRFFSAGEKNEYVPERKSFVVPDGEHYESGSAFSIRDFVNRTNDPEVMSFAVKNRINTITGCGGWPSDFGSKKDADLVHSFGLKLRGPGHCWKHLVPGKELFASHPEYFPVIKGKRTVNGRTACFSNPEVRRIFLENLRIYLRKTPWWDIFAFWAEDVPDEKYCDCPECGKLSAGGWYMVLMNEAARILEEELPNSTFEWIVYNSSETTPEKAIPFYRNGEKMLCDICIGRLRDLFTPFAEKQNSNAAVFDRYAAWQEYMRKNGYKGKKILMEYYNLCEYPNTGPCGRALLWPMDVMQRDIRFYRQEGIDGLGAFTGLDRLCFPSPLRLWLWIQLWNNPAADKTALENEFYRKFYGRKAAAAQSYMQRLEKLMMLPVDDRNIADLEALKPEAKQLTDAIALHLDYAILLKKMYFAYLQNKVDAYRKLEISYQNWQTDHAGLLKKLVAPFPLLWFEHWTKYYIGFNRLGVRRALKSEFEKSLK